MTPQPRHHRMEVLASRIWARLQSPHRSGALNLASHATSNKTSEAASSMVCRCDKGLLLGHAGKQLHSGNGVGLGSNSLTIFFGLKSLISEFLLASSRPFYGQRPTNSEGLLRLCWLFHRHFVPLGANGPSAK